MRIKLIHMPRVYMEYDQKQCLLPPIGIATLKTVLEANGHKCDQDDLNIKVDYDTKYSKDFNKKGVNLMLFEDRARVKKFLETKDDPELEAEAEKILKKTEYKGYDVIGLSLLDETIFSVIGISLTASKIIKEQTGSTIVLGGLTYPRPMVEFQQFFDTGYVDYIVRTHGEAAFLNLCYGLERGCVERLDIQGMLSRNKKENVLTKPPYPPRRMTDFYRPNFDGLPLELYKYRPTGETKKISSKNISILMLPYIFVNGCPNNCIFCPLSFFEEYGMQDPKIVAEDLKSLSKRYKTKYFFFINSNVNPTYDYVKRLTEEFKKADLNIMWNDCANFRQLDAMMIKRLKEVGAVKLIYGLECPSDMILKYVRKGITVKMAEKMLKVSHEAGIWNEIELIAGLPYETNEDVQSCVNFLDKNKKYLDYMYLARFVLKDSLLYKYPKKYGLTNVRPNMSSIYNIQEFTRKFDEVNGLKWEQKYEQIMRSSDTVFKKITQVLQEKDQKYDPTKHMPLLFYLYTVLDSKEEVREHFKQGYTDYVNDIPGKSITSLKGWIGKFI